MAFATDGTAFALNAINTIVRIYTLNATTGLATGNLTTVDLFELFTPVLPYPDDADWQLSDPIVLWDKLTGRWILS